MAAGLDSVPQLVLDKIAEKIMTSHEVTLLLVRYKHVKFEGRCQRLGETFLKVTRNTANPAWHATITVNGRDIFVRNDVAFWMVLQIAMEDHKLACFNESYEWMYYQGASIEENAILRTGQYEVFMFNGDTYVQAQGVELPLGRRDPGCLLYHVIDPSDDMLVDDDDGSVSNHVENYVREQTFGILKKLVAEF